MRKAFMKKYYKNYRRKPNTIFFAVLGGVFIVIGVLAFFFVNEGNALWLGLCCGAGVLLAALPQFVLYERFYLDGNILYINVMNRLSVDCDCDGNPAEPDMHDIGILASYDPVALDQACIDLVYSAEDGDSLVERIESRNGLHTLEHAEDIGLGSRTYELVNIDG